MKNVYKLFVVLFLLSLTSQSFAQPTFGVKGGLNFSNMVAKDDNDTYSDEFKMKLGFHIGGTAEFIINEKFSFEPALMLTTKGFKMTEDGDGWKETMKYKLLYLDIPLNGKVYFDAGGMKVYGLFGPYIGMGLSGKVKYDWEEGGDSGSESEDLEWGSDPDNDDLKRFDFGLTFGAGVDIKGIEVGLSYGLGLANVSPESDGGFKMKNNVLAISAAYKF